MLFEVIYAASASVPHTFILIKTALHEKIELALVLEEPEWERLFIGLFQNGMLTSPRQENSDFRLLWMGQVASLFGVENEQSFGTNPLQYVVGCRVQSGPAGTWLVV